MRSVVATTAVLCGILVLALSLGGGVALPWQPTCTVVDPAGVVISQGTPGEVAARVSGADGSLRWALGRGPAVSCRVPAASPTSTLKEPPLGLTPRASALRSEVRAEFGAIPDGGYGPEQPLAGRNPNGEHSLGRAIDFFFRPYDQAGPQRRGWRLANWSVANAERLGIRTVIYRDRIWTARRSGQGWREYRFRGQDPQDPVNRHLDHVHVDVA